MQTEIRQLILLVEDNAADANLIEEAFAEAQITAVLDVVPDGAAAMEYLDRVDGDASAPRPDLILLDLNLPKVSGEEVLKRIRTSPRCAKAKVLILSSSNAPADRARALVFGANGYFRKPSHLDQFMELGSKVRDMLAR